MNLFDEKIKYYRNIRCQSTIIAQNSTNPLEAQNDKIKMINL